MTDQTERKSCGDLDELAAQERWLAEHDPDDPATHPFDCSCIYCIPGA